MSWMIVAVLAVSFILLVLILHKKMMKLALLLLLLLLGGIGYFAQASGRFPESVRQGAKEAAEKLGEGARDVLDGAVEAAKVGAEAAKSGADWAMERAAGLPSPWDRVLGGALIALPIIGFGLYQLRRLRRRRKASQATPTAVPQPQTAPKTAEGQATAGPAATTPAATTPAATTPAATVEQVQAQEPEDTEHQAAAASPNFKIRLEPSDWWQRGLKRAPAPRYEEGRALRLEVSFEARHDPGQAKVKTDRDLIGEEVTRDRG
jgi:hypothetical protein